VGEKEEEKDEKIAELERKLADREREIRQLLRRIERLERKNEALSRAAKRQAAPFSRGKPKADPSKRGRKPGRRYGKRAWRGAPAKADRVVRVAAPMYCPACEKPAELVGQQRQWQTDIPLQNATTTEFVIDVARCTNCGRQLRARHVEQTSAAVGAAAVQIGPRATALAAKLNKECGVSFERIADLLDKGFGLRTSRSTLNRAVARLGSRLEGVYERIGAQVRSRPMLSPDETGWKIGGHKAWLYVAATREESFYRFARGRGRTEAEALIGREYKGTIVRDGWIGYRGEGVFAQARSQTCIAHILRRIGDLIELDPGKSAVLWLVKLKKVLKRALRVRDRRDDAQIGPHGLMVSIGQIESEFDRLLRRCPRHPSCRRLSGHLQREREAMFTFLHCDAIPASNYLAEQAIRPAVVNRKMSGGNNTLTGAHTQQVLMTILHTARKRGIDFIAVATNALRDPSSVDSMFL
jgi:transposase